MDLMFFVVLSVGERKHKREGPCVGTKGFRAPEVRSLHLFTGI